MGRCRAWKKKKKKNEETHPKQVPRRSPRNLITKGSHQAEHPEAHEKQSLAFTRTKGSKGDYKKRQAVTT